MKTLTTLTPAELAALSTTAHAAGRHALGDEYAAMLAERAQRPAVRLLGHEAIRAAASGESCWCEACAGRRVREPELELGAYVHRYSDPTADSDRGTPVPLETAEEIAAADPCLVWLDVLADPESAR